MKPMQEFLSRDILDEDYIKIFAPYRVIQQLLGSCRVDIRDRFVTAPSILQKCYTIAILISIAFATMSLMHGFTKRYYVDRTLNNIFIAGIFGLVVILSVSLFYARFFNNDGNVQLHIKLHEIDRIMKLNNHKINKLLYKYNIVTAFILVFVLIMLIILSFVVTGVEYNIHEIVIPTCSFIAFIIELSYVTSTLTFFTLRVFLINSIIINHLKKVNYNIKNLPSRQDRVSKYFEKLAEEWQDFDSDLSEPDIYLKEIFRGFILFQDLYNFQIFVFFTASVAWIFITVEYGILALQKSVDPRLLLVDFLQLTTVAVVKIFLLLMLCIRGEIFCRSVKTTKRLSIVVVSRYVDGPLREKAVKIIEMVEETSPAFCVYGMWELDARLLLTMFRILTSWLVTLLQFAFL